jgi:hypothetical protein
MIGMSDFTYEELRKLKVVLQESLVKQERQIEKISGLQIDESWRKLLDKVNSLLTSRADEAKQNKYEFEV